MQIARDATTLCFGFIRELQTRIGEFAICRSQLRAGAMDSAVLHVTPTQRNQGSSSTAYERNFITLAGQSTLTLQLQQFGVGDEEGENNKGPLSLIVRYPEDQRRERVKFALKGLDLF